MSMMIISREQLQAQLKAANHHIDNLEKELANLSAALAKKTGKPVRSWREPAVKNSDGGVTIGDGKSDPKITGKQALEHIAIVFTLAFGGYAMYLAVVHFVGLPH